MIARVFTILGCIEYMLATTPHSKSIEEEGTKLKAEDVKENAHNKAAHRVNEENLNHGNVRTMLRPPTFGDPLNSLYQ